MQLPFEAHEQSGGIQDRPLWLDDMPGAQRACPTEVRCGLGANVKPDRTRIAAW